MGTNGNVGIVTSVSITVINYAEPLVEEVIKAFVDVICLSHHDSMAFNGRVTDCCNSVNLQREREGNNH